MSYIRYNFDGNAAGTLLASAAAETGGTWAKAGDQSGSDARISSTKTLYNAVAKSVYYSPATVPANYDIWVDYVVKGSYTHAGVIARGSAGTIAGYPLCVNGDTGKLTIYKNEAIQAQAQTAIPLNATTRIRWTVRTVGGNTVIAAYDAAGNAILMGASTPLTYSDSTFLTGPVGFYLYSGTTSNDTTGTHLDNIDVTDPAIVMGTVTATAGLSSITLTLTGATSGGSGSGYTYAIYRDVTPNFTPAGGNLLASGATFPYIDASPVANAVNYYRVVVTDSSGNTGGSTLGGLGTLTGGPYATPGQVAAAAPKFISGAVMAGVNIVAIGTSISFGTTTGSPSTQAPPIVMAAAIAAQSGNAVSVRNQGYPGSGTVDWAPGGSLYNGALQASNINSAASQLNAAAARPMIVSIELATNDSATSGNANGNRTKAQYKAGLAAIIEQILTVDWPSASIVLHCPIYFSPNAASGYTYGEASLALLQQYQAAIDELVALYAVTKPGQVFAGDKAAYGYFARNYATAMTQESGIYGNYTLHPNTAGAAVLGQYQAVALYNAIAGAPYAQTLTLQSLIAAMRADPVIAYRPWLAK